tara:strand:+ start:1779 stop:2156 length:378 start_codon:yes stop_codon:yes gene_type:complete
MSVSGLKNLLSILFLVIGLSCQSQTQEVYITKTGEKYHTENCRYLKTSKIVITLEKALENGYEACKVCNPIRRSNSNIESSRSLISTQASKEPSKSQSVQCSGKTKKGLRCKRITTNSNGRCYQH